MHVGDVMTTNVVSVTERTPVHEIVGLLLQHRISAVPVLNTAGGLVGMVSEGDLLRPEGENRRGAERSWWLEAIVGAQAVDYARALGMTAGAIMTKTVVTTHEEMPLDECAALLERHHIKRVPVVRDGKLIGIVSRANLLHGLATAIVDRHEPGAERDRQLRARLAGALLREKDLAAVLVNVTVNNGEVKLWGVVDSAQQARTAESVARALPGVRTLENNLSLGPMSGVPV